MIFKCFLPFSELSFHLFCVCVCDLLIHFRLHWVSAAVHAFSLVAASRGLSLAVLRLLTAVASLAGAQALGTWARRGLVAPRHVGFSRPGTESMSPTSAGRFLTSRPPGMSLFSLS